MAMVLDVEIYRNKADGQVNVWIGYDMPDDREGIVIGSGTARDEAVAMAVRELEEVIELLQSPAGVIPERVE